MLKDIERMATQTVETPRLSNREVVHKLCMNQARQCLLLYAISHSSICVQVLLAFNNRFVRGQDWVEGRASQHIGIQAGRERYSTSDNQFSSKRLAFYGFMHARFLILQTQWLGVAAFSNCKKINETSTPL